MFGSITKFHFIPLLCASALYIIGECFSVKENKYNVEVWNMGDEFFIPSLIFSAIGLFSLLFIWLFSWNQKAMIPPMVQVFLISGPKPFLNTSLGLYRQ